MISILERTNGAPLIKIQTEDRIDSLRSGFVYMNSLQYYRDLERANQGDDVIGDAFEGQLHVQSGSIHIPSLNQVVPLDDQLLRTSIEDAYAFCLFSIPEAPAFAFSALQNEKLPTFGDSALVITDRDEFVRRLFNRLAEEGYRVLFGNVSYYDPTTDNVAYFVNLIRNGIESVAFNKRSVFAYQQEFRIVAISKDKQQDHISVNIRDISDISEIIPVERLLGMTFIQREN